MSDIMSVQLKFLAFSELINYLIFSNNFLKFFPVFFSVDEIQFVYVSSFPTHFVIVPSTIVRFLEHRVVLSSTNVFFSVSILVHIFVWSVYNPGANCLYFWNLSICQLSKCMFDRMFGCLLYTYLPFSIFIFNLYYWQNVQVLFNNLWSSSAELAITRSSANLIFLMTFPFMICSLHSALHW